nr:DExH-box ATP-dependent RNA helicase DExH6-like [Ipomoea batatas]
MFSSGSGRVAGCMVIEGKVVKEPGIRVVRKGRMLPAPKGGRRNVVEIGGGDKVRLHPCSTNFKLPVKKLEQPTIQYDEITRGDSGEFCFAG